MAKKYWLVKSEPTTYSIDDLKKDASTDWTGIRNYQVRNFIRDHMKKGDMALFYHSSCKVLGVYGTAEIVSEAMPDPTQFDKKDSHFDSKSKISSPTWHMVRLKFSKKFKNPVPFPHTRGRLSMQPVSTQSFNEIVKRGG